MNSGYLLLIGSMVALGISTLFFQKSTQTIGASNTTLWYYIFGLIFSIGLFIFSKEKIDFTPSGLVWPLLTALFLSISVYLFTSSLKSVNISVAATARSLSFIVTIVIAYFFTNEPITIKQLIGFVFAIIAIICMF